MRSPLAGWRRLPIALVVAILGALVAVPASVGATPAPVAPLAPADEQTVAPDPVLRWTESDGRGYELRWNADGSRDASGALDPAASGGRVVADSASHVLDGLDAPTYHWQVRALPDGPWSAVSVFHLDTQLDTLALPGSDRAADPSPASRALARGPLWVAGGAAIAAVILVAVAREWRRSRRAAA